MVPVVAAVSVPHAVELIAIVMPTEKFIGYVGQSCSTTPAALAAWQNCPLPAPVPVVYAPFVGNAVELKPITQQAAEQ